jgi:hypothetical protein
MGADLVAGGGRGEERMGVKDLAACVMPMKSRKLIVYAGMV